jgi:hypothetical protein
MVGVDDCVGTVGRGIGLELVFGLRLSVSWSVRAVHHSLHFALTAMLSCQLVLGIVPLPQHHSSHSHKLYGFQRNHQYS